MDGDTAKLVVLTLFFFFHEEGLPQVFLPDIDDNNESEDNSEFFYDNLVEIPAMLRIKTYSPERYGLSTSLIKESGIDFINISPITLHRMESLPSVREAFRYKFQFLSEGIDIIRKGM